MYAEDHTVLLGLITYTKIHRFIYRISTSVHWSSKDKACVHDKEECHSNKGKATGGAQDWGQVSLNTCHLSLPRGFTGTGKTSGGAQDWGKALLNTCHLSLPGWFTGTGKATGDAIDCGNESLNTFHLSLPGRLTELERPLEVAKVEDMLHSPAATQPYCGRGLQKAQVLR